MSIDSLAGNNVTGWSKVRVPTGMWCDFMYSVAILFASSMSLVFSGVKSSTGTIVSSNRVMKYFI